MYKSKQEDKTVPQTTQAEHINKELRLTDNRLSPAKGISVPQKTVESDGTNKANKVEDDVEGAVTGESVNSAQMPSEDVEPHEMSKVEKLSPVSYTKSPQQDGKVLIY